MGCKRTVVAACTLMSLASCGSDPEDKVPLDPPVAVHGVLRMTGGPAGASQLGVEGRVKFVGPGDHAAIMEIPTRADGTFSLELNPGSYKVTGQSPQYEDGKGVCRTDGGVSIKSGSDNNVTVNCDRK